MDRDVYYIYLEDDGLKCVVKMEYDFDWFFTIVKGDESLMDIFEEIDNHFDIDDVIDFLNDEYEIVKEIDLIDIDDYYV